MTKTFTGMKSIAVTDALLSRVNGASMNDSQVGSLVVRAPAPVTGCIPNLACSAPAPSFMVLDNYPELITGLSYALR